MRGRGAAQAVVVVAPRACPRDDALGVHADDGAARRLCTGLGDVVTQELESRR